MNLSSPAGLILSGGGARAAYQVGVLKAIAEIRRDSGLARGPNPFMVLAGTSAGAINTTALACGADNFDFAVGRLLKIWEGFQVEQVYRADSLGIIGTGASWLTMMSIGWLLNRWRRAMPRSLLDNSPLSDMLRDLVPLGRIPVLLSRGHLQAVAVTAFSYTSGRHVTFYLCGKDIPTWQRSMRIAVKCDITYEHLLASAAIPFVFPAVQLPLEGNLEYFGDGSMRQVAPVSPGIHLGAQRLLVVGAGRLQEPPGGRSQGAEYPSVAQIAGHALSNIFLDALAVDVERVQRINKTLSLMPPDLQERTSLRPIDLLVIAPTQRLDDIAARHVKSLPASIRALLRALGVQGEEGPGHDGRGAALASYLLFEAPYTRELIDLGYADAMAKRGEVEGFFGWRTTAGTASGAV